MLCSIVQSNGEGKVSEAGQPESNNRRSTLELFILSAAALYLELLIIRWLSAEFRAFTVFKTFPLVTCYIGLGLGFAAVNDRYFRSTPWAFLAFLIVMKVVEQFFQFSLWAFPSFGVFQWWHFEAMGGNLWAYILVFICILLLLLAGPFAVMACIGTRLGQLFGDFKPLTAYGINLLGSIFGSIIFSLLAFTGAQPWILLIPPLIAVGAYAKTNFPARIIPCILTVALASWLPHLEPGERIYWSPYQKLSVKNITLTNDSTKAAWEKQQGIVIGTNGMFYQYALDLSEKNINRPGIPAGAKLRLEENAHQYNLPYKLIAPKNVLVLGAGSGNDVAAAVRHGAQHIDAVDIDPIILDLGKHEHPERPYDSSKVTIYCDDARDFLNRCTTKYDLIVFAGLDSHTVAGEGSSVRLDNFVYTKQSIGQAMGLLNKDGVMFLSFCKSQPWLSRRLYETISAAAGYEPITLLDTTHPERQWEIFVTGDAVRDKRLKLDDIAPFAMRTPEPADYAHILTDDWPFIYVTPVGLDVPYLVVVCSLLILAVIPMRKLLLTGEAELWQMFFLGSAFILLELQAIARLSLLFGSTWMTSSLVINSVLLMIFAANYLVAKAGDRLSNKLPILYMVLFVSLAISFLLPMPALVGLPYNLGRILITLFTVLPMFMAGLVFPISFNQATNMRRAYAFNLLGAVLGSMLEYMSNYVGINSLVLIALVLYAISFAFFMKKKKAVSSNAAPAA
ncbi:MAG TPA: hypothetical protein V6C81_09065 [Planktothrix sp.]